MVFQSIQENSQDIESGFLATIEHNKTLNDFANTAICTFYHKTDRLLCKRKSRRLLNQRL
jgi:hypothetical protein